MGLKHSLKRAVTQIQRVVERSGHVKGNEPEKDERGGRVDVPHLVPER